MHKVIKAFLDLQDGNHLYNEGDTFPREGSKPSPERIKELAGKDNKIGEPLIKAVRQTAKKKAPSKKK